jgi:hypothetical protein
MLFLPKVAFKWREPKQYLAARDLRDRIGRRWWRDLPLVAIVGAMMLPLWYLATLNPKKHPPSFEVAVLLGFALGVFLVYVVPWMNRLCPSEVKFFTKSFLVSRGNNHRTGEWKDVSSWDLTKQDSYDILTWRTKRGLKISVALDGSMDHPELTTFFQNLNIPRADSEQNEPENPRS